MNNYKPTTGQPRRNGYIPRIIQLTRLNQEETENQNKSITSREIESVIKNFPKRKAQNQKVSLVNSTKHLKKNSHQSSPKFSKKTEEKGTLSNFFYKSSIMLISKLDKDTTEKEITGWLIIMMNKDAKILNKNWQIEFNST